MSRFIEAVEAKLTGKEEVIYPPLKVSFTEGHGPVWPDRLKQYEIGVRWTVYVRCDPERLDSVMTNVTRELREVVYGSFRDRIIRLERAMYEYDLETMYREVRDLLREVLE